MSKVMIIGGAASSLINFRGDLIDEYLSLGLDVIAVAAPGKVTVMQKLQEKGVQFKAVPLERDRVSPLKDISLLFKIYRILKVQKPDYLFVYTVKPVIYGSISARLIGGIKVYAMITGLGYAFAGKSFKQKVLSKVITYLYRIALRKNKAIFFQNGDDLSVFRNRNIISNRQNAVVVNGSGVNTEYYYQAKVKQGEKVTFLLISRMLKSKGIYEYIEAAREIKKRYNQVRFRLIGPISSPTDSIDPAVLNEAISEGVVEYTGWTDDVRPHIELCNVYVLPSYREGTPRSVLEAMSMGRAIITTDAPGCRETVEEGINGFLVPVRNSAALVEAMEKFIIKPEIIEKMGFESRRIAENKFDVTKVNRDILKVMGLTG